MNWGYKVLIAYLIGVSFISIIVIKSMMVNTEMVEDDYYNKELVYNSRITAIDNANHLLQPIRLENNSKQIIIEIDSIVSKAITNGEIHFYNPASEKADKKFLLKENQRGLYFFEVNNFLQGKYFAKISFESGGKSFYAEKIFFIH